MIRKLCPVCQQLFDTVYDGQQIFCSSSCHKHFDAVMNRIEWFKLDAEDIILRKRLIAEGHHARTGKKIIK